MSQHDLTAEEMIACDHKGETGVCEKCGDCICMRSTDKGDNMSKLSYETKRTLQKLLFDNMMGTMFGDGLEDDYIWDGVEIVGINQLSEEQLVKESESYCINPDLLEIARAELAVDEMLGPSKCPKLTELRNTLITDVVENLADYLHNLSNTELLISFAKNDDDRFDLLHAAIIADE